MPDWLGLLPHRPPMRLVADVVAIEPGIRAVCRRPTAAGDWFFDGHFPGEPVVPAIVLVELLAQTGGLAIGSGAAAGEPLALRVAALGGFKFPGAAIAGDVLEATARVVGRMGGLYKIEGEVTVGGRVVTADRVVLALPFSILRAKVDWSQAGFSDVKSRAIRELGMGTNAKLNVGFTGPLTVVPLLFVLPSTVSFFVVWPRTNCIWCLWPSRSTMTSSRSESAFTTDTPTPCSPPDTL